MCKIILHKNYKKPLKMLLNKMSEGLNEIEHGANPLNCSCTLRRHAATLPISVFVVIPSHR